MSTTGRQNNLFLSEDWKKIYQTFKNADFTSYDFENIRRVMIAYLREKYPENFNDYIESSEYLALIDLIAFLGQSLAFRIDLNARENFLELAERRESVLRLAQMLSYNAKRNICANGLLKVESISTTQEVIDSAGRNLQNIEVVWNDPSNGSWFDQYIKIMNSAMVAPLEFGVPQTYDMVSGVYTEQYRLASAIGDLPVFPFNKTIDGKSYSFEVMSTVIKDNAIQEDTPLPFNRVAIIYRDDQQGYGSPNTGWFMHFRQGVLSKQDFSLTNPTTNQIVNINDVNINNDDVWLYSLNNLGNESAIWKKVPTLTGNNVIYNSIDKTIKNIYGVQTTSNDGISLVFGDGVFANLPRGSFRCYYRTSAGATFTINPKDLRGVQITVPYLTVSGSTEELKLVVSLKSSVSTATSTESNQDIKTRAPATYYTQDRMITGEDYNLAPLAISQSIAKVKSVNRSASGISRNYDLIDPSGKYSSTNAFCTDGILYRENIHHRFDFTFNSLTDIENVIKNKIEPLTKLSMMRDFYYAYYDKLILTDISPIFKQVTSGYNETTAYLADKDNELPFSVGIYTGSILKYVEPGCLLKIVPPAGYYFAKNGTLVTTESSTTSDRMWVKVVSVTGDGKGNGSGKLSSGLGPILVNDIIPDGSIVKQIIPKFLSYLSSTVTSQVLDSIFNYRNFGLRYDSTLRIWSLVQDRNLNLLSAWSLGKTGDNTGQKLDSSWVISFTTDGETYKVDYRGLEYYFESIKENRFFFDGSRKIYDSATGLVQKDKVSVLKFNTKPNSSNSLVKDYAWEIIGNTAESDGYTSSKAVKVTFSDTNDDGIVDNPEEFDIIVDPSSSNQSRFVFFEKYITDNYVEDYRYISNDTGMFRILESETQVTNLTSYNDGQLFYFYQNDIVKKLDMSLGRLVVTQDYYANIGRNDLYFHYIHNAESTMRIDPSSTNIMDIYLLTKNYDNEYRKFLRGDISEQPLPPSSTDLRLTYGVNLDKIKSISDEIIYHPVKYKVLFGSQADKTLQASFKVVKNKEQVITENDIKTRIVSAINQFFALDNWDFGDTFYFSELSTFVMNKLMPYITTFIIVPSNNDQVYGSLQQITSAPNEIFISGTTVSDIEIIEALTAAKMKTAGYIVTTSIQEVNTTNILSSISY